MDYFSFGTVIAPGSGENSLHKDLNNGPSKSIEITTMLARHYLFVA